MRVSGPIFDVLRARTQIRPYRGRRVPFSCFARTDSFFGGTEGVRCCFLVLRTPDSFSAVSTASIPVFMFLAVRRSSGPVFLFCALGHFFGGTEGIGSYFHVSPAGTRFQRNQGRRLPFSCFFVPGLVFGGTEGAGSRVHVLRSRTHFMRYRGRRGDDSHFCALRLVCGGNEGDGSRFHVLRARTSFRR
jgi:hypothetical protein